MSPEERALVNHAWELLRPFYLSPNISVTHAIAQVYLDLCRLREPLDICKVCKLPRDECRARLRSQMDAASVPSDGRIYADYPPQSQPLATTSDMERRHLGVKESQ